MIQYKKILLLTASLVVMFGCEKIDSTSSTDSKEKIITYTSAVTTTKATPTVDATLNAIGSQFNIATFLTDADNSHYYTDLVKHNGTTWSSGKSRYWPVVYNLNMYAYSPIKDFITVSNSTSYEDYTLQYICPSDIDKQVDLLVKTLKNQTPPTKDGGAVEVKFLHALSGIKFNVELEGESNVTLGDIAITYTGIEKERTYNFLEDKWNELENIYFGDNDNTTTLTVNKTVQSSSGKLEFGDTDSHLMIIPQPISGSNYISIQLSYTLNNQDNATHKVVTAVKKLPAPTPENIYKQGEIYTYNIKISGKKIEFGDITITDQTTPVPAFGNINLGLITEYKSAADIGYTGTTETSDQYYFTAAERVKNLLNDGVRDFVVVGSVGAVGYNTLGNGKLGYYGNTSSPFFIGAQMVNLASDDYFSVDLRGTYGYPLFKEVEEEYNTSSSTLSDDVIGDNEPIFIAGLFAHIDWLDEVIFPHGLAAIGDHSFDSCDALSYVDLSDVKHIEVGSFQNCKNLKIVDNGKLTRIHEYGFHYCESLTTIDLSLLTEVDDFGFVGCNNLTNVNLSKLDHIGAHAFEFCSNLTLKVGTKIPGFTMVEDYAFNGCYELGRNGSKIDLEEAVKVGAHAFTNCQHIQLSSENLSLLEEVGMYGLSGCTDLGNYKKEDGTVIKQEFKIPSLKTVNQAGFSNCPNINIVNGLANLKKIDISAFQNCTSLTGYSATATNKSLSLPNVKEVADYGLNNTAITNVEFTNLLTTIGRSAFDSSAALTTITGLEYVTTVGISAFSGCTSLEKLDLPLLTSENCGGGFFYNCLSLKTINLPKLTENEVNWTDIDSQGESITHESTIIGMISSDVVERINLDNLVLKKGDWSISNKPNLVYVNLASAEKVGYKGFTKCTALKTLILSSAKEIGYNAFEGNIALQTLNLPEATIAQSNAFVDCTALEELLLPKVDIFGGWACFSSNSSLKYVDLSSATQIIDGTFADCTSIVSIDLSSVTTIGNQVFALCSNLKKINLSGLDNNSVIDPDMLMDFDTTSCDLWLSDSQYAEVKNGNEWQDKTWNAIYKASDTTIPFTLK